MPDELVERILHCAMGTSAYNVFDHKCQNYRNILQACCRFKMIKFREKRFLPRLYIHPIDALPKSTFNGKVKVGVRKTTLDLEQLSQFVIFKPVSYGFEETIGFDVKASFASRPRSRLIR